MPSYSPSDRYGRLTPIAGFEQPGKPYIRLLCICDCGTIKDFYLDNLRRGLSTSCGCLRSELAPHNTKGNFLKGSPIYSTYRAWTAMKARCLNPKDIEFSDYGGRGIKVCDRWMTFDNFFVDMGYRPNGRHKNHVAFSLDRINTNGDYEPANCRWATWIEQASNRRPAKTNRWKKLRKKEFQ